MAYLYFRVSFNKARTEFGREREVKRMRGNRNGENKVWKLFGEWTSTKGRTCILIHAWCVYLTCPLGYAILVISIH